MVGYGIGLGAEQSGAMVEIIAAPKSGNGHMWVYLEPKIKNIKDPVKFEWSFGEGEESTEMLPKPHYYEFGRFAVVLEVTDKTGKRYTASVTVDAATPG